MQKKLYKRELFLKKIRGFYSETEIIKVVTGVRRCGKSSLLETIGDELREKGVNESNIIFIHLDKKQYIDIKNPKTKKCFPNNMILTIKKTGNGYEYFVDAESGDERADDCSIPTTE